jgi:DNA-directed RNA polymerase subunit M/transcription elongation factor TFIIS
MYSTQQIANENLGAHQRGIVECEKCHSPIEIRQPGMVSVEFCVPCPKCGHRGIYFKRMIYSEDAYERRKTPRG